MFEQRQQILQAIIVCRMRLQPKEV